MSSSSNGTAIRQPSNRTRPDIGSRSRRRRFGPRSIQPCIFLAIGLYVTLFLSILFYIGLSGKFLLPIPSRDFVKRGRSAVTNGLGVDTRSERRRKEELLMQSQDRKKVHHRYKRLLTIGPDILGDGIVHGIGSTGTWNHKRGRTTAGIFHINRALYSSQMEAGDRNTDDAEKEEEESVPRDCHPMASWQTKFYPTCNDVHTLDITAAGINKDEQMTDVLALGGKRIAWRYHTILVESTPPAGDGDGDEIVVMKTLQWNKNFTGGDYATNQRDVVAMEQLSSSSRVVSPYGHCGVTVVNEYGYLGGADMYLGEDSTMQLSKVERLRFARDAALAIADVHAVHGEKPGSTNATALVHGDVRPWNFVLTYAPGRREKLKRKHRRPKSTDVVLKLHDFNAAKFVEWNATGRGICRFENNVCNMFRSPDECRNVPQDEKIDVYGLGHVIFFLLTNGQLPLKGSHLTTEERADFVRQGNSAIAASLSDYYGRSDDPSIVAMRLAMIAAERFDPTKRASAASVAKILSHGYYIVTNKKLRQGYYDAMNDTNSRKRPS